MQVDNEGYATNNDTTSEECLLIDRLFSSGRYFASVARVIMHVSESMVCSGKNDFNHSAPNAPEIITSDATTFDTTPKSEVCFLIRSSFFLFCFGNINCLIHYY